MKILLILSLLLSGSCTTIPKKEATPYGLVIVELTPTKWTALTKQNMLHLSQVYDLEPFLFTKRIHIASTTTPHSHPVLTLNTKYAENPKKLLSSWLHEELHWWAILNKHNIDPAIKDLKKIYQGEKNSTYLHLLICYVEKKALELYLGKSEAREIITSIMNRDRIHPWAYQEVLQNDLRLMKVVQKHKLLPSPLI